MRNCHFVSWSRTRTVVRECCKGDDASQWRKWEIRPLATPKPLNRSSPKVAYVIRSWMVHMQNSHDPSRGFFSPYVRNCASKWLLGFFPGYSNGLQSRTLNRLSRKYVKQRGSAFQGCAFLGLENKKLTLNPFIPEKPPFLAQT